ncbi:diguanylate cyclase [Sulfurimonas sp.]
MESRILLVEDNKTLSKLITRYIQQKIEIKVDVAYSMSEAKLFLARYNYFVTILDINLPDAPNGEIITYALKKGNRIIVMSSTINKEFRKNMLQNNIIDYIPKTQAHEINFIDNITRTIQRIQKNQNHEILVVDDSMVFRRQMKDMLENLYFKVITVAHGEEALGMLKENPNISLVLTDYNMPVMDGLELTIEIRKEYSKDQLSIVALSGSGDDEISALFLKNGANDYITKPFSKEEFSCRVNNAIEALENIQLITQYANRDYLTGLYNRRYFYNHMNEYLENINDTDEKLSIAMIDIDHFKKVNDTYGHDVGDGVIVQLSDILRSLVKASDIVARFGGEEFCVVLKNVKKETAIEILERIRIEIETVSYRVDNEKTLQFTISIGATMYSKEEDLEENISRADMMLYKAKNSGRNRLIFDEN